MLRVYISINYCELKEWYENIHSYLGQIGCEDISAKYHLEKESTTLEDRLKSLETCDLYVGIFTFSYGNIVSEDGKSVNHVEFRKAIETKKECIIFLLRDDVPWTTHFIDKLESYKKIENLRDEISKNNNINVKVVDFKSTEDLTSKLCGYLLPKNKIFLAKYSEFVLNKYKTIEIDDLELNRKLNLNIELETIFVEPDVEIVSEITAESINCRKIRDIILTEEKKNLFIIGDKGTGKSVISQYVTLSILDLVQDKRIHTKRT